MAWVVVNDRPNVDRREYERLKAIIHNAAQHGAASQTAKVIPTSTHIFSAALPA